MVSADLPLLQNFLSYKFIVIVFATTQEKTLGQLVKRSLKCLRRAFVFVPKIAPRQPFVFIRQISYMWAFMPEEAVHGLKCVMLRSCATSQKRTERAVCVCGRQRALLLNEEAKSDAGEILNMPETALWCHSEGGESGRGPAERRDGAGGSWRAVQRSAERGGQAGDSDRAAARWVSCSAVDFQARLPLWAEKDSLFSPRSVNLHTHSSSKQRTATAQLMGESCGYASITV